MSSGGKTIPIGIKIGTQECASAGEVGEWRDKMATTHPGWADIMKNKVLPKAQHVNNKTITDKYRY